MIYPNSYGTRLREGNDCHKPAGPGGGQFCSKGGAKGYRLLMRSQVDPWLLPDRYRRLEGKESKLRLARIFLQPRTEATGYLGAPTVWKAPNGVEVFYKKGQRRSEGGVAVFHDFDTRDELVIPLTRNIGAGRRALRAWAATFLTSSVTTRMQARQMVRPGD